ncbi:hypothetical protein KCU65_g9838, partial [Aureobasidium melanogenum]
MLPNSLRGSYTIYKEDTDSVTTWLASTARRCGYPLDLLTLGENTIPQKALRLKGKARKLAKAAASAKGESPESARSGSTTYTIAIKDFIPLAEHIVAYQKPPVKVPSAFVKSLDRAIALRQKHNSWFKDIGRFSKGDGHTFFLGVLEQVRKTLRSRMPSDTVHDAMTRPSAQSTSETTSEAHIGNAFAEITLDITSDTPSDSVSAPGTSQVPTEVDDGARYQAERLQKAEEQYLAAHCLLADIDTIREHIKSVWDLYRDKLIDLHAASITTNTAVELVRLMQEDYDKRFPDHADFEGLVTIFYGTQCIHQGEDPEHKETPDDPFNFAMYEVADEILLPAYVIMSSLSDISNPREIPIYKSGHFGHRDLSTTWSQKSPRGKFEDDKLVMLEAFAGLRALAMNQPLAEDELIRGIREMTPGKKVPLWLVFAAQNFLDIQHVMGDDVSRALTELQSGAALIEASLAQNFKFHENLRSKNWPPYNDQGLSQIQFRINTWVKQDAVKMIIEQSASGNFVVARDIGAEPYKLLKQYPSLCGLWLFSLKYLMQDSGITFCNAWGSIMYSAHLYNAARQENLVESIWKDMEMVLLLQGDDKMFVGDRPKNTEDYLKRFNLCLGYSAAALAKNKRKGTPIASAKGPRVMTKSCVLSKMFSDRYINNTRSLSTDLNKVEQHIKTQFRDPQKVSSRSAADTAGLASVTSRYNTKQKLDAGTFLEGLANAIHAEGMHLTFDYFRLHRFSWMLLRSIKGRCAEDLRDIFGYNYIEREDQLPCIVGYLFRVALSTERMMGPRYASRVIEQGQDVRDESANDRRKANVATSQQPREKAVSRPHDEANSKCYAPNEGSDEEGKDSHYECKTKRTAAGIPTWSPTVVLICRSTAYVWQSGRDAQFSADC